MVVIIFLHDHWNHLLYLRQKKWNPTAHLPPHLSLSLIVKWAAASTTAGVVIYGFSWLICIYFDKVSLSLSLLQFNNQPGPQTQEYLILSQVYLSLSLSLMHACLKVFLILFYLIT